MNVHTIADALRFSLGRECRAPTCVAGKFPCNLTDRDAAVGSGDGRGRRASDLKLILTILCDNDFRIDAGLCKRAHEWWREWIGAPQGCKRKCMRPRQRCIEQLKLLFEARDDRQSADRL